MWVMKLRHKIAVAACALLCLSAIPCIAADTITATQLDAGYRHMYNLQFDEAHKAFQNWQQEHPDDPLGPVSDAAAYLFTEFDRLHILESELFVDDKKFESRSRPAPNAELKRSFESQLPRHASSRKKRWCAILTTSMPCSPACWRTAWRAITWP